MFSSEATLVWKVIEGRDKVADSKIQQSTWLYACNSDAAKIN
jgi:hypothetical protein